MDEERRHEWGRERNRDDRHVVPSRDVRREERCEHSYLEFSSSRPLARNERDGLVRKRRERARVLRSRLYSLSGSNRDPNTTKFFFARDQIGTHNTGKVEEIYFCIERRLLL